MTFQEVDALFSGDEGKTIREAFRKLYANLRMRGDRTAVGVSGGSDSDVMVDMIYVLEPEKSFPHAEIHYVWFDTGLEYGATKEHLAFLEQKYGITIERRRAKVPVPLGCKTYGLPFLSKQVSQYISRLQAHGFKWEDEPFDALYARYPKCKAALRWWCNEWGEDSRMNINRYRGLKEFMAANPPDFMISDECCHGAKKDVAYDYLAEIHADLNIVGVRKAEGGARATAYTSCFSEAPKRGCAAQLRPLFFLSDRDKELYCQKRGVVHSALYESYGFVRTGCACCPFGRKFEEELKIAQWIDPKLAVAAKNIFGPSYEYTRAYRQFRATRNVGKHTDMEQISIFDNEEEAT